MLMSSHPTVSDLAAYRRQRALLQRVSRQEDVPDGVMPKIVFLLKLVQSLKICFRLEDLYFGKQK